MNFYYLLVIIILLSAVFSYINFRFIRWPQTIGIMALSLIASVLLVLFGTKIPALHAFSQDLAEINFNVLLMKVMLGFLLFAGGFHINASDLRNQKLPILTLASFGTILSTFIIGGLAYLAFGANEHVPFIYCLVFGALISPTDPIAVLGILKEARIPHSLELKIAGESLFNDGVAVVVFMTIATIAATGTDSFSGLDVALLFLKEAGGGILYGLVLGYVGYWALRSIDNYKVEVLITLSMVMAGYYFADTLHVSGPLAMVVAGIVTGNKAKELAMSDITRDYLSKFWELIDEILNAILFLLIGLEMIIIPISSNVLLVGVGLIFVVLFARWISVGIPFLLIRRWVSFEKHAVTMLTWGGLRGGISVALALSLPASPYREKIIAVTYIIVIFSILVQGLSIGPLAKRLR